MSLRILHYLGLFVLGVFLISCHSAKKSDTPEKILPDSATNRLPKKQNIFYGIPLDNMAVEKKEVKRNETFSDIFKENNLSLSLLDSVVNLSDTVFDMRKIRQGHAYYVFSDTTDTVKRIKALVYEITPLQYYRIFFDTLPKVDCYEVATHYDTVLVAGTIQSSLWNAVVEQRASPQLAIDLSEIYAWTIDFFELSKGDKFTVKYQRIFADTAYIGLGKIIACQFIHDGISYDAFYYRQDEKFAYFDEKGNSLQKQFLKAPLRYSRISSRFSNHRYHPVLKIYRPHHGVDYAAPMGTPVHSIGDGKVIKKGYDRGGGNFVKIKHNSVYTTTYMHLSRFAKGLKVGKHVVQGELIGYVGKTGLATGPHLDFRVYRNGSAINPLKLKSPPTKPIADSEKKAYLNYIKPLKKELEDGTK